MHLASGVSTIVLALALGIPLTSSADPMTLPAGTTITLSGEATITYPAPVVMVSANPDTVETGDKSVITWNASNVKSCDGWEANQPLIGQEIASPVSDTSYKMECVGYDGSTHASSEALVKFIPDPVANLSLTPDTINLGQSAQLNWTSENTAACQKDGSSVPLNGTSTVSPKEDTTYKIDCSGMGTHTVQKEARLRLMFPPPPPPPIVVTKPAQIGVGMGCTTAYYIDKDCDGYGTGKKASGTYLIGDLPVATNGTQPTDSTGDLPDADDMDPDVNTTASWQAKWGTDNNGMIQFLKERKGFTNSSRIFYIALDGDDTTGVMNDPTHPFKTVTSAYTAMADRQGGAVIFRGGNWGTQRLFTLGTGSISGSPGHVVYLMSYPGELATTSDYVSSSLAQRVTGNVTVDGLAFREVKLNIGDNTSLTDADHDTFINNEFIGGHQTFFGIHNEDHLLAQNVYHHMSTHAIYFGSIGDEVAIVDPITGDINFDLAEQLYRTDPVTVVNPSTVPSYRGSIFSNVMYNNGSNGYEPIHLNNSHLGVRVDGNIISYGGGTAIGIYHAHYHGVVTNNVAFDNSRDAVTFFLGQYAKTHRFDKIANNSFFVGNPKDGIRGSGVGGGINVVEGIPANNPATGYFPNTPGPHYLKNNNISNNIVVSWGSGVGSSSRYPLVFDRNSFPDTDHVASNIFWESKPSPSVNDTPVSITANNGSSIAAGQYTSPQFVALSSEFSGNITANPLFTDASSTYLLTPGKYNLALQAGSPAINAGSVVDAPKIDVRGYLRDANPDIGAYEYHADNGATPLVQLGASSRRIQLGQTVTLTWQSLNADSCTGVGFNSGGLKNGSVDLTPSVDTTYNITCQGPGGGAGTQDLFVQVMTNVADTPTFTFTGPTSVATPGAIATLHVSANGPVFYRCAGVLNITSASSPYVDKTGVWTLQFNVKPLKTTTYGMLCYNQYGVGGPVQYVTVTVP